MKKWMLCVLCFALILSLAGCGFQSKTAEEMIALTLTPQYARDITDEWLDANIATDYQSFEKQDDGAVILKMTTEQYTNYIGMIRSGIISVIRNMEVNEHNNIADISFNDNFSEFRVTFKTDTLYHPDVNSAYYLLATYGRFYQHLTTSQYLTTGLEDGLEDCSVVVTCLDADGNILEKDYRPE